MEQVTIHRRQWRLKWQFPDRDHHIVTTAPLALLAPMVTVVIQWRQW